MSGETVEIVIVGARVAGSILATLLGQRKLRVLVVDAGSFPSDTVSTHFFRGSGLLPVIERTGGLTEVLNLGSPRLVREHFYINGDPEPKSNPASASGALGFNLSVRRGPLDALLSRRASQTPGVELAERTTAVRLFRDDGRVTGVELASPGGARSVDAKLVVGADGRNSWLAAQVRAPLQTSEAGHRGLYYAYFSGFDGPTGAPDGAEFSINGDEVAYVFPSDQGLACIALSVDLATYRWFQENPAARFVERMDRHPGIASRMRRCTRVGGMRGSGPIPNFVRQPFGPGWALVGDSEMHQDPWSGMGMDCAGLHAGILADTLVRWHVGEISEVEAGAIYARERDKTSMEAYETTVRLSRDIRESLRPRPDS